MGPAPVDSIDKLTIHYCEYTCHIKVVPVESAGIKNVNVVVEGASGYVPEPVRKNLDLLYPSGQGYNIQYTLA